jgi:hypothetical protein
MATHTEIGNAYAEPDDGAVFRKFLGACIKAAGGIMAEAGNTPNHNNRVVWARGVLSGDQQAVYSRVRAVKNYALATDPNVQFNPAAVTDADVDSAVQTAINVLATGS